MSQQALIHFLQNLELSPWAAVGIAVLFILESAPFTGLLLPGIFLAVGLGSLSGAQYLPFSECILFAAVGALLGDSIGYWAGYLSSANGRLAKRMKSRSKSREKISDLFNRYGKFAVFLGRFAWFVHPLVPIVAGLSRIRPTLFYLADVPAVLLWILFYTGLGHWAGDIARKRTIEFIIALSIIALIALLVWGIRSRRRKRL